MAKERLTLGQELSQLKDISTHEGDLWDEEEYRAGRLGSSFGWNQYGVLKETADGRRLYLLHGWRGKEYAFYAEGVCAVAWTEEVAERLRAKYGGRGRTRVFKASELHDELAKQA